MWEKRVCEKKMCDEVCEIRTYEIRVCEKRVCDEVCVIRAYEIRVYEEVCVIKSV